MMHVLIVDDQTMLRFGMHAFLKTIFKDVCLHEASCLASAKKILQGPIDIQLVITDLQLNNRVSIDTVCMVRNTKSAPVLIYSELDERLYALEALRAGADGYIMKNTEGYELKKAIEIIVKGKKYLNVGLQTVLLKQHAKHRSQNINSVESLTFRELTVMRQLTLGKCTKEIASSLNLKCNTISTYKKRIYRKMNVIDSHELLQKASII